MMAIFYLMVVFGLGLSVGSFLNALIHRLETGESIFRKEQRPARSYCPKCGHKLGWQDLIPLLSFIFLRGSCRYCSQPISLQYPLVELSAAALFLLIFNFSAKGGFTTGWQFLDFTRLLYLFFIGASLIVIFVYDLKHYIISDKIIYPAIGLVFLYLLFEFRVLSLFRTSGLEFRVLESLLNPFLSAILASAFFAAIVFGSQGKWMGVGDVKLAFLMGLFLGFPNIVSALFMAFLLGAVVGIILILSGKKSMKSEVPFGPFLVTGTFIALFWGQQMIEWYWTLFI